MSLLVRKIDKSKWFQADICNDEDVSEDAITNCMRTKQNALSVWQITSESEIEEAVLAIVSGHQYIETIDVIPLESQYLRDNGIDCLNTTGLTPVEDLEQQHVDLSNLSYRKLGTIAYHIVNRIKKGKLRRYTVGRVKDLLREAISNGRLRIEDLSDSVRSKLE